jgi:hypothetical protein
MRRLRFFGARAAKGGEAYTVLLGDVKSFYEASAKDGGRFITFINYFLFH